MIKITTPHADGIKFKCGQCKKFYVVKNGKHQEITDRLEADGIKFKCGQCKKFYVVKNWKPQEITDRLEIEDLSGNLGEEQTLCSDCFEKYNDSLGESTSLHH